MKNEKQELEIDGIKVLCNLNRVALKLTISGIKRINPKIKEEEILLKLRKISNN